MANTSGDDPQPLLRVVEFPKIIRRAGMILIVCGGLIMAITAFETAQVYLFAQRTNQGGVCCDSWVFVVPAMIGYLLVRHGIRLVRGVAGDTLFSGIVSGLLGLPIGCLSGVFLANAIWDSGTGSGGNVMSAPFRVVLGSIGVVAGFGMLASGILSLIGRNAYREWKLAKFDRPE